MAQYITRRMARMGRKPSEGPRPNFVSGADVTAALVELERDMAEVGQMATRQDAFLANIRGAGKKYGIKGDEATILAVLLQRKSAAAKAAAAAAVGTPICAANGTPVAGVTLAVGAGLGSGAPSAPPRFVPIISDGPKGERYRQRHRVTFDVGTTIPTTVQTIFSVRWAYDSGVGPASFVYPAWLCLESTPGLNMPSGVTVASVGGDALSFLPVPLWVTPYYGVSSSVCGGYDVKGILPAASASSRYSVLVVEQ